MRTKKHVVWVIAGLALTVLATGCGDRNPAELESARAKVDPVVFDDDYSEIVYYQGFFNTFYEAVSIDSVFAYGGRAFDGARSLRFRVPPVGSALGDYTGGVLTSAEKRDLTDFNALTFYARASRDITLNLVGYGNDNTGNSLYEAGRPNDLSIGSRGVDLTGEWSFVVVPIPAPSRLRAERGLFTLTEACEEQYPEGYDIWVDEIRYAQLSNIEVVRIRLNNLTEYAFVGSTLNITGAMTIFALDGASIVVPHSAYYFDYESTDPAVATATGGVVTAVGPGTATISASLENFEPSDPRFIPNFDVNVFAPPTVAATPPTLPAADVISLFSDVYTDVLVDTWRADWSQANLTDYAVQGDATKMYTSLRFVGILFETLPVDASAMTHLHLDVYAPAGTDFEVKLAAVPLPGWQAVQPPQVNIILNSTTTPAFNPGGWSSLEIPLDDLNSVNLTDPADFDWANVNQLILASGSTRLVLVDNVYFHK